MLKYYVYFCKNGEQLLYIGYGSGSRIDHCKSGRSHVAELNEIVLRDGADCLNVYKFKSGLSKQQAFELEGKLILKLHPKLNVDRKYYAGKTVIKGNIDKFLAIILTKCDKLTYTKRDHLIFVLSSLINNFGFKNIEKGCDILKKDINNCVKCGSFLEIIENSLISPILSELFFIEDFGDKIYIQIIQKDYVYED